MHEALIILQPLGQALGSPLFNEWRGLVAEFFAQPPFVEHFQLVGGSFDALQRE